MKKIYYGWWIVFACFFIYFFVSGMVYSFTAFFEPISAEFGWSYTKVSIAASIRGLELGLFAPVMGLLVDRFESKRLLFSGIFTIGCGLLLLSLTNSLALFYGASVIFSLGISACSGPVIVPAVAKWFRKDLGKAMGIISAGLGAGGILVPLTVFLIRLYEWRATLLFFGFGIWLLAFPLVFVFRRNAKQPGHAAGEKASNRNVVFDEENAGENTLLRAIKSRVFWHISISDAIRLMASIALITHIMPYLSSLNIARSKAALVTTAVILLSIIGRLALGWLGDIFSKNYVMALAYFFAGISFLAFAYIQMQWLIIPFLIFYPLSWGASPLRDAATSEYFGGKSLGSILGLMAGIGMVSRVLGPSLAGWTYDTFGGYHPIWLFFAASFGVAVVLMLTIKPLKKGI